MKRKQLDVADFKMTRPSDNIGEREKEEHLVKLKNRIKQMKQNGEKEQENKEKKPHQKNKQLEVVRTGSKRDKNMNPTEKFPLKIQYERDELLLMATSPASKLPPPGWQNIINKLPVKTKTVLTKLSQVQLQSSMYDEALPSSLLDKCNPENCGVCSVTFGSQVDSKAHYDGKNHHKKVRQELEKMFRDSSKTAPKRKLIDGIAAENNLLKSLSSNSVMCSLCNILVSSEDTLQSHMLGKAHRKKFQMQMTELDEARFCCDVCGITTTDNAGLIMHLQGAKHRARVVRIAHQGNQLQETNGAPPQFGFNLHLQQKEKEQSWGDGRKPGLR